MTTTDDIFARPPRALARMPVISHARLVGRVACAACGLRADVLICQECATDPEASRQRVKGWLAGVLTQMDVAIEACEAVTRAHAPLWAKIQEAQERMSQAEFDARWQARRAEGGAWGALIAAVDDRDRALQPLAVERDRLERALSVLGGCSHAG